MEDFEKRLQAFSDRVLSKALTEEEQNGYAESLFESIKHINEVGQEFWYARELQIALGCKQWRRFENVIKKAITSCENSNNPVEDHFANVGKISERRCYIGKY